LLKPTRIAHAQMESVSDASRLLDLDGLAVDRVESDAFGGWVVHVVTGSSDQQKRSSRTARPAVTNPRISV
jgi:hypothetical protein